MAKGEVATSGEASDSMGEEGGEEGGEQLTALVFKSPNSNCHKGANVSKVKRGCHCHVASGPRGITWYLPGVVEELEEGWPISAWGWAFRVSEWKAPWSEGSFGWTRLLEVVVGFDVKDSGCTAVH
jgi:hypothetical protein